MHCGIEPRPLPDLERPGLGARLDSAVHLRHPLDAAHGRARAALLALGAEESEALAVANKLARRFTRELAHTNAFNQRGTAPPCVLPRAHSHRDNDATSLVHAERSCTPSRARHSGQLPTA
jgi:hypothetical protein